MLKVTHSLLASWLYSTSDDAGEGAFDSFLATLRGEHLPPSDAALKGRAFEADINYLVQNGVLSINDSQLEKVLTAQGDTKVSDKPDTDTPYWRAVQQIARMRLNFSIQ